MHMIRKKNLSDAKMNTLTKSCSPTIVITANGEVQTHEEAIVYVKELCIFLTMKVVDNTPPVLSLRKLCDERRGSDNLQYGKLRFYRVSRLVKFVLWIFINFINTYEQESHSFSSSASSSSSPTVGEIQVRDREDGSVNDTFLVSMSDLVEDGSRQLTL